MKKSPTPTPPQSPKPIFMGYVTSFPQHSSESDTITIYQMLWNFSQQEIVPTKSILKDFLNHIASELSSNHNKLACVYILD